MRKILEDGVREGSSRTNDTEVSIGYCVEKPEHGQEYNDVMVYRFTEQGMPMRERKPEDEKCTKDGRRNHS